ncbi:maleylpyruvate isomerase family mycothiol-dependent enzyme [Arsenicicoccus piscis]|uniref:Maleylpyruvate isomerase n=1 Tax=Arsenicicoccus piscis TaxID=673954 RepID=A0ABQ6HLI9_9MICO|nr:maleylpyruvate isomerase family mycothiol-dependent enzyme [Arsenicicoccus piscis]MCH8628712.1 maleylpyruvate isomerase family mycothiol-dependent enzyme [Arsenicicoccus piscis]GMA19348.1 maleylpyruvate isomerase [Arsenicicoccus piscis]
MTDAARQAELSALVAETAALLDTARSLDDAALREPSLCQGWTRAHVLSHLWHGADALGRLVTSAETGTATPLYASPESRAAEIEEGARADRQTLLDQLSAACDRLATALAGMGPDALAAEVPLRGTTVAGSRLAWVRRREVGFHHVDLRAGYTFSDVDPALAESCLADLVDRYRANPATPSLSLRTDEGDVYAIGDGRPVVSAPRAGMLLWTARGVPDGIDAPPADQLPTLPSLEVAKP